MTSGLTACGGPDGPQPNILFLMPDQFRGIDIGVMGNSEVLTPNLDQLASEGVLLRNTIANCPVCSPARGTILTGRLPHHHGVDANDYQLSEDEVTIAEVLRDHGYRTGFTGKWHLHGGEREPGFVPPGPLRQGFDFWAAHECSHEYWRMHYFRDDPEPVPISGFSASTFADLAIEFLTAPAGGGASKPFCLFVEWGPPHDPYFSPPEFTNLYDADQLTIRPNWQGDEFSRRDVAAYYAAISFIDHEVGRLLEALEQSGQKEDTIVLVTSDHGDMLGSQGALLKRKPWEESIRVPGILRYPAAVAAGQQTDLLFSHLDMMPTLLGLARVDVPDNVDGLDHSSALMALGGEESAWERPESVYLQIYTPAEENLHAPWRGVRTEVHTYARHEDRPWVLYDNKADPFQQYNLIGKPEAAELQARLDQMTMEWFERTGDDWRERRDFFRR